MRFQPNVPGRQRGLVELGVRSSAWLGTRATGQESRCGLQQFIGRYPPAPVPPGNHLARAGLAIPRSTLAQWMGTCSVRLQPLVDALKADVLGRYTKGL